MLPSRHPIESVLARRVSGFSKPYVEYFVRHTDNSNDWISARFVPDRLIKAYENKLLTRDNGRKNPFVFGKIDKEEDLVPRRVITELDFPRWSNFQPDGRVRQIKSNVGDNENVTKGIPEQSMEPPEPPQRLQEPCPEEKKPDGYKWILIGTALVGCWFLLEYLSYSESDCSYDYYDD